MREIKIRYTCHRKSDGHIWQTIVPIECFETRGDVPAFVYDDNETWEVVARDLWTGIVDKNGRDIYAGDVLRHKDPRAKDGKCVWNPLHAKFEVKFVLDSGNAWVYELNPKVYTTEAISPFEIIEPEKSNAVA